MVNLTRIYTRTGDDGSTRLGDMSKTRKTDPRVSAYGDVNEANAHIGVALVLGSLDEDVRDVLTQVQNDLFDVGADFSTPIVDNSDLPQLRVTQEYVDRLEGWCDAYNEPLEKLRSFILPGGSAGSALLHLACTASRRAERSAWIAWEEHGATMNRVALTYLNRLSDLLFILARHANLAHGGDVLWQPGGPHQSRGD
jgi:cob(I)alamin adenosyltransferase